MIAVGNNNYFILGRCCFHKYLYFHFSSNVCPCWSLFFLYTFGRDMGVRNTCPFFYFYYLEKLQLKNEDRH